MSGRDRIPTRGAGGGGKGGDSGSGSGRAPVESPDSLRSVQYARVLDLLSEGECAGLVAGSQGIYLDDTPLQNADGSYNFTGVAVAYANGTQAQAYLPGFAAVESETTVQTEVTHSVAVVRSITNANVDAVRVTIGIPRLALQNTTTGDLTGTTVQIAIEVQSNGGGYVLQPMPNSEDYFNGKTTTRYQRSYRIALTGSAPWDIRVSRPTADSIVSARSDKTYWDSFTEIIDSKFRYPNSMVVGLQVDASQFAQIPRRSYDLTGLKISYPSNYTPSTRAYSGVWDGTFTTGWTNNPAWCFYDLLTNNRYGLGAFINVTQVDKWALYSIAQYCDALVADGFGGFEPRYTCNLYLQTRAEAFKVITNMASIFRGMTYWAAGSITAVADMPTDPIALFTMANVIEGKFSYAGSAKNTRHTVALVTWNDPADAYRQKVEYVADTVGVARYGVNEAQIVAFGCTSRGQAHRAGKWLLFSERLLTETVTFRTGLDGTLLYPGAVINTQDAARAGKRFGGRVLSGATTTVIPLNNPVTLVGGITYTLMCMTPTGTLVQSTVTTGAGTTSSLTVSPALSAAPQANAVWVLAASDLAPEVWRVLAVTEVDKTTLEIVALAHNSAKYDAVEKDIIFEQPPTSSIKVVPSGVTNLLATETLFEISSGVVTDRLTLSWSGTTGRYKVSYRGDLSNWVVLPETPSQTIDIDGLNPDNYNFTVVQISSIGLASPPNTLRQSVLGKTAVPADITGFTVIKSTGFALAQWTLPDDLDVRVGGHVVVRQSPLTSGAAWSDGIIFEIFPGSVTQGLCPLVTGTYMAKALDSSGNYSDTEASFVLTEGMITGFTTVGTLTEAAAFAGAKTNLAVAASKLSLASGVNWDSVSGNIDSVTGDCDSVGGQSLTGSYAFNTYLDLTTVASRRFEADITARAVDNTDNWDSHAGNMDDVDGFFDGVVINDCDVTLYAAITNDDPAVAPIWSPWFSFMVADFTCRAAKFKLDFAAGTIAHNIQVSVLTVHAKIPV